MRGEKGKPVLAGGTDQKRINRRIGFIYTSSGREEAQEN